jgi:hypothetical protein
MEALPIHSRQRAIPRRTICRSLLLAGAGRASRGTTGFGVLTFNILQGGLHAPEVGFPDSAFDGNRVRHIAEVIRQTEARIVGVQEDDPKDALLKELGSGWQRVGNVYSTFPLTLVERRGLLTICRAAIQPGHSIAFVNAHWHGRGGGAFEVQRRIKQREPIGEAEILRASDQSAGPRGYQETLDAIRGFVAKGENLILTGDFNEPSHLDWTERYAKHGADRWVKNSSGTPLRQVIRWKGSTLLHDAGLKDAYRVIHSNEAAKPGDTWTPEYPDGLPGRRQYAEQVLDRIDRIYYTGPRLRPVRSSVVGEDKRYAEVVYPGPWPSDHRAVLAVFEE